MIYPTPPPMLHDSPMPARSPVADDKRQHRYVKPRIGSLFSGTLALDMATEEFFDAELAWVSDIDPGACKILTHRTDAPNLGDITAVDWAAVEPVDILTGGWPCQPFSLAGKRRGADDERALWPYVADAVRHLRPRHVVLENVAAIATAGELGRAVGDLAAFGYVGQWRCLRAADVGAPHGRARIFIVAYATSDTGRLGNRNSQSPANRHGFGLERAEPQRLGISEQQWHSNGDSTIADAESQRLGWPRDSRERGSRLTNRSQPLTDPAGNGWDEGWPEPAGQLGGSDATECSATPTDANSSGCAPQRRECAEPIGIRTANATRACDCATTDADSSAVRPQSVTEPRRGDTPVTQWGVYEPAIRRWESILGRTAPAPTELSPRGSQRLSPRFVEWMMGLPAGWVTDVPGLGRNQHLKALGNGVVPQQALAALQMMNALERAA